MKQIILASKSPRRKEILEIFKEDIITLSPEVDESYKEGLAPDEIVKTLALRKARAALAGNEDSLIIGSDTVVYAAGKVLGKPKDSGDAKRMLALLSGNVHSVFSGVAVICGGKEYVSYEETKVYMRKITERETAAYISSGEGADKAGAYGIQGKACAFIERIDGSYHNVMGLPIYTLCALMREAGEELI